MSRVLLALATHRPEGCLTPALAGELLGPLACDDAGQLRRLRAVQARAGVRQRGCALVDVPAPGPAPAAPLSVIAADAAGGRSWLHRDTGDQAVASEPAVGPAPADLARWHALYRPRRHPGDQGPTTSERMACYEALAPPLGSGVAARALAQAGLAAGDVRHLVTVSCTGFFAPGLDAALIERLGLASDVSRTHVGFMGCHGLLNGLRVADALAREGPVLLVAVELCSLHLQYGWDPGQLVPAALFADGAAALVLAPEAPQAADVPRLAATGGTRLPGSAADMSWRIGAHGFRMTLSRRVPDLVGAHLRSWLQPWLERQGVALHHVGGWAVHPGGPRVLDAVAGCLGLPPGALAASRAVLAANGNMSSPTVAFILAELARREVARPWVALAFGPGLVVEAALLT